MDQYHAILQATYNLLIEYIATSDDLEEELEREVFNIREIGEIQDFMVCQTEKFRLRLLKHSVFLSEEIIDELDRFYNNLYDTSDMLLVDDFEKMDFDCIPRDIGKYEDHL